MSVQQDREDYEGGGCSCFGCIGCLFWIFVMIWAVKAIIWAIETPLP